MKSIRMLNKTTSTVAIVLCLAFAQTAQASKKKRVLETSAGVSLPISKLKITGGNTQAAGTAAGIVGGGATDLINSKDPIDKPLCEAAREGKMRPEMETLRLKNSLPAYGGSDGQYSRQYSVPASVTF